MSVTPRGMSVQEAYREYRSGNFKVNRRYQRKLVWTLEEKTKLIGSILHGYPIPLFLLAKIGKVSNGEVYEILDGLQRLDAIFSFIENKYSRNGKYFDVNQHSRAKQLAESGEIEAVSDDDNLLSPDKCANILDYQLAVTIFPSAEERDINEVFSRINSYGRNLSSQDKRQAGVVTPFADLVRSLAADFRGDSSPQRLDLSQMADISIDVTEKGQDYGIDAKNIFWCKEGILRRKQLRDSQDEQFIADLAVSALLDEPFPYSRKNMDEVYTQGTSRNDEVEESLAVRGREELEEDLWLTYQEIKEVVESSDTDKNFADTVNPENKGNPVKTEFYAFFMAFYNLLIDSKKVPGKYDSIMNSIEGLHSNLNIARGSKSIKSRKENINIVRGLIEDNFVESKEPVAGSSHRLRQKLSRVLQRSRIESNIYECKQGILNLDTKRSLNEGMAEKIVTTVCGIANCNLESEGALIIGVADNKKDAERIQKIDNLSYDKVGNRYIVGIDREAKEMDISIEKYERKLVSVIRESDLSGHLKQDVLSKIDTFKYRNKSVLYIPVQPQENLSMVGDEVFVRESSSTIKIESNKKVLELSRKFE